MRFSQRALHLFAPSFNFPLNPELRPVSRDTFFAYPSHTRPLPFFLRKAFPPFSNPSLRRLWTGPSKTPPGLFFGNPPLPISKALEEADFLPAAGLSPSPKSHLSSEHLPARDGTIFTPLEPFVPLLPKSSRSSCAL